jgi:hypothetical protein
VGIGESFVLLEGVTERFRIAGLAGGVAKDTSMRVGGRGRRFEAAAPQNDEQDRRCCDPVPVMRRG